MKKERILIVCPDKNVKLWTSRYKVAATGGGKTALLKLAEVWAKQGSQVTFAAGNVKQGRSLGVNVVPLESLKHISRCFDVVIYLTGSLGHFDVAGINYIQGLKRIFWINGPNVVKMPPGELPHAIVVPCRFMARRAIDEWGYSSEKVVVIPGEAITRRRKGKSHISRIPHHAVYASHPSKGLNEAVRVLERLRPDFPKLMLHIYGSAKLWGDDQPENIETNYPPWVKIFGSVPQLKMEKKMERYGVLLHLSRWKDSFSPVIAEAMNAGVIVIATAHGASAELIQHGWNGFLVRSNKRQYPDLNQAESLLRSYFTNPYKYERIRENAMNTLPTWEEKAKVWRKLWMSL